MKQLAGRGHPDYFEPQVEKNVSTSLSLDLSWCCSKSQWQGESQSSVHNIADKDSIHKICERKQ